MIPYRSGLPSDTERRRKDDARSFLTEYLGDAVARAGAHICSRKAPLIMDGIQEALAAYVHDYGPVDADVFLECTEEWVDERGNLAAAIALREYIRTVSRC